MKKIKNITGKSIKVTVSTYQALVKLHNQGIIAIVINDIKGAYHFVMTTDNFKPVL